jgi:Membrane bound FAD containing D-sorbitol dehydrogenase
MPSTPFLKLSSALTGERRLDEELSQQFETRITVQYGPHLAELLTAFEKRLKSGVEPERAIKDVLEDAKVDSTILDQRHRVARAIVWAWYTGQFNTPFELPDAPQTPEQYSKGLLWHVIRAHAPAFTDAQYGAWAKQPPPAKDRD